MSMSSHIVFLRDKNDPQHQRKVKVLRACAEADVALPDEIDKYFEGTIDEDIPLEIDFKGKEWEDNSRQGFEVDIDEIPEGVKTIRFYNSW